MVPRATYELLGYWPLGSLLCQLHTAMDVTCCTVSILHLCAVSLDRYYAIVKERLRFYIKSFLLRKNSSDQEPLIYQARSTPGRTVVILLLVWLTGILVGCVSVFSVGKEGHVNPSKCEFEVRETLC